MSINSRLRNIQKSLKGRELALLWLKTSQATGGYSEHWKIGELLGRWRWVVERTFAWLNQFRLRVRYEKRADMHLAFLIRCE